MSIEKNAKEDRNLRQLFTAVGFCVLIGLYVWATK